LEPPQYISVQYFYISNVSLLRRDTVSCGRWRKRLSTRNVRQSPARSPPAANAPVKLRCYWTTFYQTQRSHRRC